MNNDLTNQIEQTSNEAILEALTDAGKQKFEDGKAPNFEDIDFEQLDEWQDTMNKVIQEQAAASMKLVSEALPLVVRRTI